MTVGPEVLRFRKVFLFGGGTLLGLAIIISASISAIAKPPFEALSASLSDALKRKEYQQALELASKRLDLATKSFPLTAPELAQSTHDKGMVLAMLGNHDEAVTFLERAIALDIKYRGANDIALGRKMVTLAESKGALGELAAAERFAAKAIEIIEAGAKGRFPKEKIRAAGVRARARLESNDCVGAAEIASSALALEGKELAKEGAIRQPLIVIAAKAAQCQGQIAQAEDYLSEAVSMARRSKSEELPALMSWQGELLCQLGKCRRGARLQEQSYKAAQKLFGAGSPRAEEFAPTLGPDSPAGQTGVAPVAGLEHRTVNTPHFESF